MKIKQIKISDIGPHKNTEIDLGSRATIIFAENGTGKSLFANSFSKKNNWLRGWNKFSYIDFIGDNNLRERLTFDIDDIQEDMQLPIFNNCILYDDWIFNETLKNHYANKILLPSDDKRRKKVRLEKKLSDTIEIIKLNDIIRKLNAPPKNIIDKYNYRHSLRRIEYIEGLLQPIRRSTFKDKSMNRHRSYLSNNKNEIANKIFNFYNKNYNKNFMLRSMEILDKVERSALRMYLEYSNKKEEWDLIPIFKAQLSSRYIASTKMFKYKKIPSKDIRRIKNALIWVDLLSKTEMRRKIRFLEYYIQDNYNEYAPNIPKIDFLQDIMEQIQGQIQKINEEIKKDKQKRKLISKEMNIVISNLPMSDKIFINENLEVISEEKKISLSSGEIKILDIILFVELNKNEKKTFLFDDPLTSADTNYIRSILAYLKKTLGDSQMIFLTHNEIVLNELRHRYKKEINLKSKNDDKKVFFYIWKINKKSKVQSSEFPINTSAIQHAWRELKNDKNDSKLRVHYGRIIFEHMAFVAVGQNDLSSIYDNNKEEINWFGKKIKCSIELWKDLNKYSHYNLNDFNNTKNYSYLEVQINKIILIIKEIGFDLKINKKLICNECKTAY